MNLIVIKGKKASGKTLFANLLHKQNKKTSVLIKNNVMTVFVYCQYEKVTDFDTVIIDDPYNIDIGLLIHLKRKAEKVFIINMEKND